MEHRLIQDILRFLETVMRQPPETQRRILVLLKKHFDNFKTELFQMSEGGGKGAKLNVRGRKKKDDVDLSASNIIEEYMLHELYSPPVSERGAKDEEGLL